MKNFSSLVIVLLIFLVSCFERNKERKPEVKTSNWAEEIVLFSKIKRIDKSPVKKIKKENERYLFSFSAKIFLLEDSLYFQCEVESKEDTTLAFQKILGIHKCLDTGLIVYYQNHQILLIENKKEEEIWSK